MPCLSTVVWESVFVKVTSLHDPQRNRRAQKHRHVLWANGQHACNSFHGSAKAAATAAEYFRDVEGRDILFFVDNIYRHVQALTELSTNLGLIPSEGGYSATVFPNFTALKTA